MADYKREAIDFLVYSYFGIAPNYSWDKCVKYAIMKAYGDATAQGAYNTMFKKDTKNIDALKKESADAKNKSAILIFDNIEGLFKGEIKKTFDSWHHDLCKKVVDNYSKVKDVDIAFFTYGNAQKWINMTIKYICVLDATLPDEVSGYHDYIDKHFNEFHVPVDSYIIESIWVDKIIKLPIKENVDRVKEKYDSTKVEAWSKWTVDDNGEENPYSDFQKTLTNNIASPLKWENETWINQAELRKQNNKKQRYNSFFKKRKTSEKTSPRR